MSIGRPFSLRDHIPRNSEADFCAFAGSLCGSQMTYHTVSEQACAAQGCPGCPWLIYPKTWHYCPIPLCRSSPTTSASYRVSHKIFGVQGLIISENEPWPPNVMSSTNFGYHNGGQSMLLKYIAPFLITALSLGLASLILGGPSRIPNSRGCKSLTSR